MKPMHFSIATLGCKSNQFESQAMAKLLTDRGHILASPESHVDAYLINTCSVTAVSDKKSRQTIRKIKKENPHTIVGVCGCYAQMSPEEISALDVNLVGGTGNHLEFIENLEEIWTNVKPDLIQLPYDDPRQRLGIENLPSGGLEGRTRALLKIQDGCENYCTYCIIPYTRGKLRSLSPMDATLAIHDLIAQGFQEIVLTGIEISSWGKDLSGEQTLVDFLEMANGIAMGYKEAENKEVFFRLGSLEPRTITEEFCSTVSTLQSIRPHFHLSLQSGCDTVLKRMNRKYDTARFYQSVTLLRKYFSRPAITTDLIVGFPSETQEEFDETLGFLEKVQLSAVHVFPYSKRPGTPADKMPNQLSNEVKSSRSKEATALTSRIEKEYQSQFIGETLPILFESQQGNLWTGHSPQYFPVTIEYVESTVNLQNTTQMVTITEHTPTGLKGTLLRDLI